MAVAVEVAAAAAVKAASYSVQQRSAQSAVIARPPTAAILATKAIVQLGLPGCDHTMDTIAIRGQVCMCEGVCKRMMCS